MIEELQAMNPADKELVKSVFEGSLRNNQFEKAAKMASQLLNKFKEPRYALIQVQLLYMDHVNGGSPMSLQFAIAFAEKYLATLA